MTKVSVPPSTADCHPQRLEDVQITMVKADLKKVETQRKEKHGAVLARTIEIAGLSNKQAAALLGTDESTLSRWLAAKESQQTWRFEQHPELGNAYLEAQAERRAAQGRVEIETVVRIRRAC